MSVLKTRRMDHAVAVEQMVPVHRLQRRVLPVAEIHPVEILRNLARISEAGSEVVYTSVDVRDPDAVSVSLAPLTEELGPITGLVHGAGVLADRNIEDKSDEDFASVYDTKVGGLRSVLTALVDAPLKVMVMFSSSILYSTARE